MHITVTDLNANRVQLDYFIDELMKLSNPLGIERVKFKDLTLIRETNLRSRHVDDLTEDKTEDHEFNAMREMLTDELIETL